MSFQEKLSQILTKEQILRKEPMSRHTTFRAGGPADYYLKPEISQAAAVLKLCREAGMEVQLVGNGSNLLVGDGGIRGAVVELSSREIRVSPEGTVLIAQAGASLAKTALEAAKNGLHGLEFASGIPGSVGGAVVMNAGAYGGEIKDVLKWAKILLPEGSIREFSNIELEFSYRHSIIPGLGGIVLEAAFQLEPGEESQIRAEMERLREQRNLKQPLEYPSAGSTFKRPEGYFAGKLIMDAGLSGFRIGDAQVSEKHCGFVINRGTASAEEIRNLIGEVQLRVQEKFGVMLEPEVRMIGEFR